MKRCVIKLLLLAVLAVSLVALGQQAWNNSRAKQDQAEAAALVRMDPGFPTTASGDPLPKEAAALAYIDLDGLQAVNPDVVGWVEIPGTELAYPLLQGEDNQYYLTHSWKQEENSGGSIFLESTSSPDLSDFHTIVYGHRMFNNSMFGTLKYYKDYSYWEAHPSVYLVVADGIYRYDIFAAYQAGIEDTVYELRWDGREEKLVQYALEQTVLDTGLEPQPGQRHLALSTCTGRGHAKRWVVHGVLGEEYRERSASHEETNQPAGPVSGVEPIGGLR